MDQFPNELLTLVFNSLDFENCLVIKRVCTKWSKLIDELVKFRTIVINEEKCEPFILKLYRINEIVNYQNSLIVSSTKYINRSSLEPIWKNIRKLVIFNCDVDFNFFSNLEHLETHRSEEKVIDLKKNPKTIEINLKKLKILKLHLELCIETHYVLDTPELHSLNTTNIEFIEFRNWIEKITNLECNLYNECIKRLRGLKTLICSRIDKYDGNLLRNLKHLEQFQVNCIGKRNLNKILKEKKELKRIKLNVIIKGIQINTDTYPEVLLNNDFMILSSSNYQLYIDNYELIAKNLHFMNAFFVDFDIRILPETIYTKLNNLRTIVIHHQLEDEISWSLLLKSSQTIHLIQIFYPICQYYCDLIARYLPYLNTLSIQKAKIDNFEFIGQFKNLEKLITDQEISLDEFKSLIHVLDNNRFLKKIIFKYKKIDFTVEILDDEIYCEFYKCILIQKFDQFINTLNNQIKSWQDLILNFKNIFSFQKDEFKFKSFRLCYKLRHFGICDQSAVKVIERLNNQLI